jgi:hypothetical protein
MAATTFTQPLELAHRTSDAIEVMSFWTKHLHR